VLAVGNAAVDLLKKEPERRQALWDNSRSLRDGLVQLGFSIGGNDSQILPLLVGDASHCMDFAEGLLRKGIYAQGIRPPTVPPGTSRLRITPMATHTREQMENTLGAFAEIKKEHGFGI
jgi:glycine C-acetyltransferase/8-amino-7-oxononanoate synthase